MQLKLVEPKLTLILQCVLWTVVSTFENKIHFKDVALNSIKTD